ncbi:hypothetical protein DFH09DRAFT_1075472 [Mycena vulgaris]|nr:hypothetical protein DFH09DRAFT_1075472 [Mycena vulgaris]
MGLPRFGHREVLERLQIWLRYSTYYLQRLPPVSNSPVGIDLRSYQSADPQAPISASQRDPEKAGPASALVLPNLRPGPEHKAQMHLTQKQRETRTRMEEAPIPRRADHSTALVPLARHRNCVPPPAPPTSGTDATYATVPILAAPLRRRTPRCGRPRLRAARSSPYTVPSSTPIQGARREAAATANGEGEHLVAHICPATRHRRARPAEEERAPAKPTSAPLSFPEPVLVEPMPALRPEVAALRRPRCCHCREEEDAPCGTLSVGEGEGERGAFAQGEDEGRAALFLRRPYWRGDGSSTARRALTQDGGKEEEGEAAIFLPRPRVKL